jgi:hypothetical protein
LSTRPPSYVEECFRRACIYVFVYQSACKFTCILAWVISSVVTLCLFERLLNSKSVWECSRAFRRWCILPRVPHVDAQLLRRCRIVALKVLHICPENGVKISHQCNAYTPHAAAPVHSCCTVGSPVHLERSPVSITQLPRRALLMPCIS